MCRFGLAGIVCLLGVMASARAEFRSVHVGYVVPSDRTAQPTAPENLWESIQLTQAWYAEQMDRWGYGPKTFRLESSGAPNVVNSVSTAASIRGDLWGGNITAAQTAGLPIWSSGEVWFLASNSHIMQSDGSVQGGTALGASFGGGDDAGVAMLGGNAVPFLSLEALSDTTPYAGQVIPDLGPYPMVQDVTQPWFEGTTISSVASSLVGAMTHELGHAFGLPHTGMNDNNFDGPLMGNGLRGMRGLFAPDEFPDDDVWLSQASALALSTSRYFDTRARYSDNTKPSLSVTTTGAVDTIDGHLSIDFTASDASGLSAVVLLRDGNVVGSMDLTDQASVNASITTPYFDAGVAANYEVKVYDNQGNLRTQTVSITPQAVGNLAPKPFVRTDQTIVHLGETFSMNASGSTDPENAGGMQVEWDLDGDGTFDTSLSRTMSFSTTFTEPGIRKIVARITDRGGRVSTSEPIPVRVLSIAGDYNNDGVVDGQDYVKWKESFGTYSVAHFGADGNGDAVVNLADYTVWRNNLGASIDSLLATSAVPEPSAVVLLSVAVLGAMAYRCRCV